MVIFYNKLGSIIGIMSIASVVSCSNTDETPQGYLRYYKTGIQTFIFDKMEGFELDSTKPEEKDLFDKITQNADLSSEILTINEKKYNLFGLLFGKKDKDNKIIDIKSIDEVNELLKKFNSEYLEPATPPETIQLPVSQFKLIDLNVDAQTNTKTFKLVVGLQIIDPETKLPEIVEIFQSKDITFTLK